MNSLTRTTADLVWIVWLGSICTLGPSAVRADEAQLPLPPSRSSATIEQGRVNQDRPIQMSDRGPRQVWDFETHRPLRVVTSSLAIVLGGFALLLVWFRKQTPVRSSGVMETLGTIRVTPKVQLHLVRLGSRLLLLHLTPEKVQPVAEVTDPGEVQNLLAAHLGATRQPVSDQVHEFLQDFDRADLDFPGLAGSSQR